MLCTINTDASFNRKRKIGTFAFWSKMNTTTIKRSGKLRGSVDKSCEAELKTIINAIHVTLEREAEITRVIVNTDSMNSIHILTNSKKDIRRYKLQWGGKFYYAYRKTLEQFPCVKNIEYRHVKSHSGVQDARSYVNEWCDTMAKREMEKVISKEKQK